MLPLLQLSVPLRTNGMLDVALESLGDQPKKKADHGVLYGLTG